jgi:predicted transcriptional regulator
MLIKDLMTKKVHSVGEDDNVKVAAKLLTRYKISGVPVVGKTGKLKGFISERDIIAAVHKPNFCDMKVKNLMSKRVRTIDHDSPINCASKIFSQENYRLLPVVKGQKLVGIIGRKDIVKQMIGYYY